MEMVAPSSHTTRNILGMITVRNTISLSENCWRKKYMGECSFALVDTNTMIIEFMISSSSPSLTEAKRKILKLLNFDRKSSQPNVEKGIISFYMKWGLYIDKLDQRTQDQIFKVSVVDILMTTDIIPNLLYIILHEGGTISIPACILQFNVFAHSVSLECLILMVMSYDRYLAICHPLRYNAIINKAFCVKSVIASWLMSFLVPLFIEIDLYKLVFCGPNVIDHFFCDLPPILELSCSDTSLIPIHTTLVGLIGVVCPFITIIVSYVFIITTILNIRSISGRQKAFSTCSSHLTVVCIYFGTLLSVYMVPAKGQLLATSKILSLLYTVVTPLLNPFIYSLRNKDFKEAFEKLKHYLI
ncbi:olfactory receptor 5P56-like [Pseudophryne corroboree]|uniref:olfactory receptor 5P56-like n=1 Tax=Pseudophryne corroboree TaxID=495146 RepID=UPI003081A01B